jgi:hypothetical protein
MLNPVKGFNTIKQKNNPFMGLNIQITPNKIGGTSIFSIPYAIGGRKSNYSLTILPCLPPLFSQKSPIFAPIFCIV